MSLMGNAAMLLSFDVDADVVAEHDEWHTHEHLPERLSIPGFLRGTRWVARGGGPRYFVLYEVESLDVLQSAAYLERLDHPTPWTARMMPHYRGMTRGLCTVAASFGGGLGGAGLLVRFAQDAAARPSLQRWLQEATLPPLPSRPGIGGAHLFAGALQARMTNEQRIRGADAGVDGALFVTGYDEHALDHVLAEDFAASRFAAHGGAVVVAAAYRLHYSLTAREARA